MIRESEVKYHIGHNIPALSIELSSIKNDNDVYKALNCLTTYTKEKIKENTLTEVNACFETAYTLLHQGNRLIQLAVQNTFLYSVSSLLEISFYASQPARALFLKNFKMEYCRQINANNP